MMATGPERYPLNDATRALEPLIGVWDTVGEHGRIPGTVLHGRTTFTWLEPARLVLMRSRIAEDVGVPEGVAVIGADDQLGTFSMVYSDERGVTRIQAVAVDGEGLRWWRDAPGFRQRYSLTFDADGRTMTGRGELSLDDGPFEQDLDLTYTRVEESISL
jgi:hypothetical protein